MFYEVRILDTKNNLKKIVSTKELSRRHWNDFEKSKAEMSLLKNKTNKQKANLH
jgi:hypothetical protein